MCQRLKSNSGIKLRSRLTHLLSLILLFGNPECSFAAQTLDAYVNQNGGCKFMAGPWEKEFRRPDEAPFGKLSLEWKDDDYVAVRLWVERCMDPWVAVPGRREVFMARVDATLAGARQVQQQKMKAIAAAAADKAATEAAAAARRAEDELNAKRAAENAEMQRVAEAEAAKLRAETKKFDDLKVKEERRKSVTQAAATILAYFSQPQIQSRLSGDGKSAVSDLMAQNSFLLQQASPDGQSDYSSKFEAAKATLAKLERFKRQIEGVARFGEDLKTLNEAIDRRGKDLLDLQTVSQLAELQSSFSSLSTINVPFSEQRANDLVASSSMAHDLLGRIDGILQRRAEQREFKRKGQEYADRRESLWEVVSKKDVMTDRIDVSAISVQQNEQGVVAQVRGYCGEDRSLGRIVKFVALIVDDKGGHTIELPRGPAGTPATIRINDQQPGAIYFSPLGHFRNELLLSSLAVLPSEPLGVANKVAGNYYGTMPIDAVWRIYAQLETSQQQILIKIPILDSNIQKMINSCING